MALCNGAGSPSLTESFTANGIPKAICLPICHYWAASLSVTLPVCDAGRLPREPDQLSLGPKVTTTPTGALASSSNSASLGHRGHDDDVTSVALSLPRPLFLALSLGVV